mgnify:CR=1 FL=1
MNQDKPSTEFQVNTIPDELKSLPCWILWKPTWDADKEKWNKIPLQVSNPDKGASTTAPEDWVDFETAVGVARREDCGIGFVFTADYGIVGIDFDKSLESETFKRWIQNFDSYTEISPSGNGYHVYVFGKLESGFNNRNDHVEAYFQGRYFTVTGNKVENSRDAVRHVNGELQSFFEEFHPVKEVTPVTPAVSSSFKEYFDTADEVIDKIIATKQNNKFSALMAGDYSAYESQSEADMALVGMLTFYTHDENKIRQIFQQSGLWDKKCERRDYIPRMMDHAISRQTEFYNPIRNVPNSNLTVTDKSNPYLPNMLDAARRFSDLFSASVAWVPEWKSWVQYDGVRWVKKDPRMLLPLVGEVWIAYANDRTEENSKFASSGLRSNKQSKETLELAMSRMSMPAASFDADPFLLNVLNGTIDLRLHGRGFRPHSSEDYLTLVANVNYRENAHSALWRKAIHDSLTSSDLRSYYRRCMGYALLGKADEDVLFIQYGPGRSGKGTLQQGIIETLGDYAASVPSETFAGDSRGGSATSHLNRLRGKRYVGVPEHNERVVLSTNFLKTLSGGDRQTTRGLFQAEEEWYPQMSIVITSNPNRLRLDHDDAAFWLRAKLIPFNHALAPDEVDPSMRETLKTSPTEREAILNWMLVGCREYLENGLGSCEEVEEATRELRKEMDPLKEWMDEYWELTFKHSDTATRSDIFASYLVWAEENRVRKTWSQSALYKHLRELGLEDGRSTKVRFFRGLVRK